MILIKREPGKGLFSTDALVDLVFLRPFFAMTRIVEGKWINFQGRQLSLNCLPPSEKRSTLKGKNLLPAGANSFL